MVRRALQDFARHQQKKRIVVERLLALSPKVRHRFAKGGEGLGAHLESNDMTNRFRTHRIAGSIPYFAT